MIHHFFFVTHAVSIFPYKVEFSRKAQQDFLAVMTVVCRPRGRLKANQCRLCHGKTLWQVKIAAIK